MTTPLWVEKQWSKFRELKLVMSAQLRMLRGKATKNMSQVALFMKLGHSQQKIKDN
jgi:hypothetical protein